MIYVSVVVPVYSGERYLEELINQIEKLKESWQEKKLPISLAEVIFVIDGAVDNSAEVIRRCVVDRSWIVHLMLSRNYGQHPATIAGILHSSGDWVVTLDEDLQHPPSEIPKLIVQAINAQADVVYGVACDRVHESLFRDFSSKLWKRTIAYLTGYKKLNQVSSFRLIRGSIARAASSICAYDTYFDVALSWYTKSVHFVSLPLKDQRYIESKQSGYNFKSLLSHARRLAITSQLKVLRLGALLGFVVVSISVVVGVVVFLMKLFYPASVSAAGWTSLMLAQAFFGGLILLLLGIVLEYLSILVLKAHGKPLFFAVDRSSDKELVDFLDKLSL